ncbi:hypothetical protein L7F22_060190 [Adiantum nelumboides]|nr:hypothetical protein [Adiantum nelumboides]
MFRRFKLKHPFSNGFLETLQRMARSGKYYPSSQWIIPYQGRGMPTAKIESLWKCMAHSCTVTPADIHSVFVADLVRNDLQPRLQIADDITERSDVQLMRSENCQPQTAPAPNIAHEHECGRPLGIQILKSTGELYIADSYFGLLVVGPDGGQAKQLVKEAEGSAFAFTNDLLISHEGLIYLTVS